MGFHQRQLPKKKQEKNACREFEVFCGTAASQRAPRALSEKRVTHSCVFCGRSALASASLLHSPGHRFHSGPVNFLRETHVENVMGFADNGVAL
jgi:hypothetical protein